MRGRSNAGRAVVQLARIGFRVGDELLEIPYAERRVDHEHIGDIGNLHDRYQIGQRVVSESFVERGVHGDRPDRVDDQRIAVGRGPHDEFGADVAASARFVVDHERLLQSLRELLPDAPRKDVGRAAGGERDHGAYRPGRISLGMRDNGKTGQRNCRERSKHQASIGAHAQSSISVARIDAVELS